MTKKLLATALCTACLAIPGVALAKNVSLTELQELQTVPAVNVKKNITQEHWLYEVLNDFNQKYGGSILDKKALSREEAAFILVNLVGKVQENDVQMSSADKALLKVVKKELSTEIGQLSGRVAMLEQNTNKLEGRITNLEEEDKKVLRFGYGEDFMVTGSLQAGYTGNMSKVNNGDPTNFRIPLSEVYVTGKVKENLDFTINMLPHTVFTNSGDSILADAFLSTEVFENNTLQAGQIIVPIGQEGPMWLIACETVDKAQYARNYGDRMDMGARLNGSYDHFDYYIGAFNGSGINTTDTNRGMATAGWLNVKPFASLDNPISGFEVGGGYYNGHNNSIKQQVLGSYLGYNYGKVHLRGEYSEIDGYETDGIKADSWYALGAYDLNDKIQLVARYDIFDADRKLGRNSITEYTYGANYAFAENMKLKLNLVHVNNTGGPNSHRVNIMTQYLF